MPGMGISIGQELQILSSECSRIYFYTAKTRLINGYKTVGQ